MVLNRTRTLHLQVLIGCDGINSVAAKWLGLAEPSYSGRMAARGLAHFPDGHGLTAWCPSSCSSLAGASVPACAPATTLTFTGSSHGLPPKTVSHHGHVQPKLTIQNYLHVVHCSWRPLNTDF
jgi:hypothetical protein